MRQVTSLHELQESLERGGGVLLYISAPNCAVCDALKVKVEELFSSQFPKMELIEANIAHIPELGGRFTIFSAPALLIFFDGQEFLREGRNVSLELLAQRLEKIYTLYFG
ncbi:MAG: thioredoxin family protein [Epsilonproteobacteria bacterium]|nr:thioredoxin [Campylobacterota bacterium]NPA56592.1 thioredoxin family protein [Campylobacterota bacterium]